MEDDYQGQPTVPSGSPSTVPVSRRAPFLLGLAIGVVLGVGATIVVGAVVAWSPGGPAVYTERSTDVLTASVGDCLLPKGNDRYARVSCDGPPTAELYAVATPPVRNADRYPGTDALDFFGAAACQLAFENYLDESYLMSDRDYRVLIPRASAWSDGNRDVYCLLRN